jgi:hypothetical protein
MLRPAASETGFRAAPGEAARAARNRMNAMLYKVYAQCFWGEVAAQPNSA